LILHVCTTLAKAHYNQIDPSTHA